MRRTSRDADGLNDLATLLARAIRRLAVAGHPPDVSQPRAPDDSLDVSVSPRPHCDDHEAA